MHLFYQKKVAKVFSVIIFLLSFIFLPSIAEAAALSISPGTGSFEVGNRVTLRVIATSNVPFNAISSVLSFPSSIFSVESVSKAGSVLNFWVTEPILSKAGGTIKFEGVALGGFEGSTGTVVTVNLRAIKVGEGKFSFQSGQILANDGEGTDITGNLTGATFSVKEATAKPITPKPKPEPEPEIILETPQPKPSLEPPEIMLGFKYGASAIIGTSDYPHAQALITFVAEDGTKVFILGVADADGGFNILVPSSLKRGTYTATAVMIKEDKTNSDTSNAIVIEIGNIFSDVGWYIWLLLVLLILTIIYLILRTHVHFKNTSDSTRNELHKAENVIHKSFDILREDVTEYDKKERTLAEHKKMSGIKKDISDAEKVIIKEIKDIESE